VRAVAVVVVNVLGQYSLQLPASQDQHPVQYLPPDGAHPALRVGIGLSRQLLVIRKVHQPGCE
jgi:hypothetical protein